MLLNKIILLNTADIYYNLEVSLESICKINILIGSENLKTEVINIKV